MSNNNTKTPPSQSGSTDARRIDLAAEIFLQLHQRHMGTKTPDHLAAEAYQIADAFLQYKE